MTIRRILIANRGEIAVRIIRTCRKLHIETVLAASAADRDSVPATMADRTVCIGPARASESYLNVDTIVQAALGTRVGRDPSRVMDFCRSARRSRDCAKRTVWCS